jgi:patatin-like phospholipase/acyl hydrolase
MAFKILCLDGGGMRGVLSAQLLALIEAELLQQTGKRIHDYFDLIAGTSTGAILAAGLALGTSSEQMMQLYLQKGRRIFPYQGYWGYFSPQRLPLVLQHGLSAPKFSHAGLESVLKEQYGQRTLAELQHQTPKLLITAYDTMLRRPVIFKSWEAAWYSQSKVWEAVICSASAPTFFPSYPLQANGYSCSLIDGGVGANNPSTCAIVAALKLGYTLKDLRILSIGTGESTIGYPYKDTKHWGLAQWGKRIADVLMDAPQDVIEETAQQVVTLGDRYPNHYIRLQPKLSTDALTQWLDPERLAQLRRDLKGKRPQVREDIDDASPENMKILQALAEGYFHHETLRLPIAYRQTQELTITEALQSWVSSALISERDGFAMEDWR